ncbi:ankyrin repeat and MYND domain-containing protein 2-like [Branchiostoma floridae x Branchiostoma japonicum]
MAPKKGDLNDDEKDLIAQINAGDISQVKTLLSKNNVRVDCLDENGMTPLQHAAYKAQTEICQFLLKNGADVNSNQHEHGYTALMFAALSGNLEVTRVMLEAGARTSAVNTVGRTASQMAAFVGQHAVVSLINNFFSREELDHYTKPQGVEKEPKLPPSLADCVHKLILMSNLNPVKIILHLQENPEFQDELVTVARLLDTLCTKFMKQSETNEVMAMKVHYQGCVLREAHKWLVEKNDTLQNLMKYLLKGREKDGFPVAQEKFLRLSIRSFPYHESELLQQIVHNVAPVTVGDDPTALSILVSAINGHQSAAAEDQCFTCGELQAEKKCSACKKVKYCGQACQKLHWFTHKKVCATLKAEYLQEQELAQKMKQQSLEGQEVNGGGGTEQQTSTTGDGDPGTEISNGAAHSGNEPQDEEDINIEIVEADGDLEITET